MKLHPLGAELFHEDVQTDRHDEANAHFLQILQTHLKTYSMIACHEIITNSVCLSVEVKKYLKTDK
jgi:hypothetical protein